MSPLWPFHERIVFDEVEPLCVTLTVTFSVLYWLLFGSSKSTNSPADQCAELMIGSLPPIVYE